MGCPPGRTGDLLVTIEVRVPPAISEAEHQLLEPLGDLRKGDEALRFGLWEERSDGRRHSDGPRALYVISVAAELAGVHPQTLRIYERKGLVDPARTVGGSRRYSDYDIEQLRRIQDLTNAGLNLEGVKRVLALEAEIERLRPDLTRRAARRPRTSSALIASTAGSWSRSRTRPLAWLPGAAPVGG